MNKITNKSMKENYKGYSILVIESSPIAHSASVWEEGRLLFEVFGMHGAYSALKGAKNRVDAIGLPNISMYGKIKLSISKILNLNKRRAKNKIAKKSRSKNR